MISDSNRFVVAAAFLKTLLGDMKVDMVEALTIKEGIIIAYVK